MAVYAPNAPVTVSGSSSKATFTGALVGRTVSISNAKLTFENPTASSKQNNVSPSMSLYKDGTGTLSLKPHGFQRVLWQELSYGDWLTQGNPAF
jgi:hypothetical protein